MTRLTLLAPCALVFLAACGGALEQGDDPDDNPRAPTLPGNAARAFNDDVAELRAAPRTPTTRLPTGGTARYDGQIGSNLTIDGQDGYGMIGDLRMNVEFDGDRAVTGDVRDVNLLRDGTPIQRAIGTLRLNDGQQASGKLTVDADGILSFQSDDGRIVRSNLSLDLDGTIRSDDRSADAIVGTFTGFGDDFDVSGPSVDIVVRDGSFWADR